MKNQNAWSNSDIGPCMRAKLVVKTVDRCLSDPSDQLSGNVTVTFSAVVPKKFDEDGTSEDNTFARWKPWAELSMSITNPTLLDRFEVGQEFYLDFTQAALEPVDRIGNPLAQILLPHQQRVVLEKQELDEKLTKLNTFFQSSKCQEIPEEERRRLHVQHAAMTTYSNVLSSRIAAFATAPEQPVDNAHAALGLVAPEIHAQEPDA